MKKIAMVLLALMALMGWCAPAWAGTQLIALTGDEAALFGATHAIDIRYGDLYAATTPGAALAITNAVSAKSGVWMVGMVLKQAFDTENIHYTGSVALKVGDGSDDDLFLTSTEMASDGTEVYVKPGPLNTYAVSSTMQTNTVVSGLTNQTKAVTVVSGLTNQTKAVTVVSGITPAAGTFTVVSGVTLTPSTQTLANVVYNGGTGNVNIVTYSLGVTSASQALLTNCTATSGSIDLTTNTAPASASIDLTTNTAVAAGDVITVAGLTAQATGTALGQKFYTSSGYIVCTLTPNVQEALSANTKGWVRLYFRVLRP